MRIFRPLNVPTPSVIGSAKRTVLATTALDSSPHQLPARLLIIPPRFNRAPHKARYLGTSSAPPRRKPPVKRRITTGILLLSAVAAFVLSRSTRGTEEIMSSKLIPPNPDEVMVIRDVTPNVVTFSVPFLRFGRFPIGGRGTLVRLTSGALAVFSPVALTEATKAKVASLGGDVRYLVATDIEHHIFLSEWAAAYPDAKLVGPQGLPEKRQKSKGDPKIGQEPFAVVVTKQNKGDVKVGEDFDADFEVQYIDAHPNRELVFFYRPDKVLIEADLMFNLPAVEQYSRVPAEQRPKPGLLARLFSSLQTTEGNAMGMKRLMWHAVSRKDRKGFNASVTRIGGWDFETIVPCHGETIVGNGKEVFEKVFAWHLEGAQARM